MEMRSFSGQGPGLKSGFGFRVLFRIADSWLADQTKQQLHPSAGSVFIIKGREHINGPHTPKSLCPKLVFFSRSGYREVSYFEAS